MKTLKHILTISIVILFGLQEGYTQSSVLSKGSWCRVSVSENGIFRINYQDLVAAKVLESPVAVSKLALFGGPNGAIPEVNISGETFDLQEIAIQIMDINGNGMFETNDYILFYGQSPSRWTWNSTRQKYEHHTNVFTEVMSYFLTTDFSGEGKRLENKPGATNPTRIVTNFRDQFRHEIDRANPFKSSQEWYDERMDHHTRTRTANLNFPGLILDSAVHIRARFVTNDIGSVVISSSGNSRNLATKTVSPSAWMTEIIDDFSWKFTNTTPRLLFEYEGPSNNSSSWMYLDYLEFHYRRLLSLGTAPMQFRFVDSETSEIAEFRISSANSNTQVWDISDPLNPKTIQGSFSENTFSFASSLSGRPEFIAFSGTTRTIAGFEIIQNQNFHNKDSVEYVMVVHPNFLSEAERLAEFHRKRNLNVLIMTPNEVFNEFSYGRQDPMAIRRMMRHYRNKAIAQNSEVLPKYLLLFGSPSYDYRQKTGDTNFVLNYQFPTGLSEGQSLSTDDFFGFLKDGETGFQNKDSLQIGIGRFPARTLEQARTLVNKTIDYVEPKSRTFGDWRNVVTNLADDGPTEGFAETFESLFETDFNENFREINIEKIYADAFPQDATASGMRFPDAKKALRERINHGTLILNYQGHSGVSQLADEDLMNISDIQKFGNLDRLMVFFTASCNFAQYDDPSVTSGGEWSVLSPRGGAVAHIGASRVAYTKPNDSFHGIFNHFALMRHNNGDARSLGETMRLSKNKMQNEHRLKQFVLLGDPAISLALPKFQVVTDSINGNSVKDGIDTIKALNRASISGRIVDFNNDFLSDFNGEIMITVYDKPSQRRTLQQRNSTTAGNNPFISFYVQKNILFKGRVPVTNGEFRAEFRAPKEINYTYGFGKISYYASSDFVDATGVFDRVIIGGFGDDFGMVADAPTVKLFLNDTNFRSGNISNENPILYAQINDKYGINHSGSGIGHNIRLIINDDAKNQIWLNDFFEYELSDPNDSMVRGKVEYPMFDLAPGKYSLTLRVSNVFNVSAENSLEFVVVQSDKPIIGKVYNYPNPARDHTKFYFTHNAPNRIERVEIDIFDISGKWLIRLSENVDINGFAKPLEWNNMRDHRGNPLRQGVYFYKFRIILDDGSVAEKVEKMIVGA